MVGLQQACPTLQGRWHALCAHACAHPFLGGGSLSAGFGFARPRTACMGGVTWGSLPHGPPHVCAPGGGGRTCTNPSPIWAVYFRGHLTPVHQAEVGDLHMLGGFAGLPPDAPAEALLAAHALPGGLAAYLQHPPRLPAPAAPGALRPAPRPALPGLQPGA